MIWSIHQAGWLSGWLSFGLRVMESSSQLGKRPHCYTGVILKHEFDSKHCPLFPSPSYTEIRKCKYGIHVGNSEGWTGFYAVVNVKSLWYLTNGFRAWLTTILCGIKYSNPCSKVNFVLDKQPLDGKLRTSFYVNVICNPYLKLSGS